MKNSLKVFITGMWVCTFSLSFLFSSANNIRINGTIKVAQGTGDTLVLSFPLRWDNSWRDQFNWDAAWVFFKYKSGTGGWNHVNLCAGGHRFVDGSGLPVFFDCMAGNTGSSTVGLFIYPNTQAPGNTPEITCQVKCLKSSLGGLTAEKFTSHEGFVLAQAVEMVYVPYGAYYLGDGSSANRFTGGSDGSPVLIDSEDAITASTTTKVYPMTNNVLGSAQNIAAVYPKGYKGFYMMKYEVSQEQWVYFLNTLTYAQQQERVSNLMTLKGGDYIFGSKSEPSNRNGIIVAEPSDNGSAITFANNLHNDDNYSQDDDGKTIACNYLSPGDMAAYCSWSGLRPMSELEYEKACRQGYPEPAIPDEYAWHDNSISGRLNAVSNGGARNERSNTANANVNAGNTFGPVRCGLFATGSSTQQTAGAAFWGGMELSGNLKEMCYNLIYTGFNGSTMGTGAYNTALWSIIPIHFGVRGGGFSSADSLLRVSDRTEMTGYFADFNQKDSTVGFRGVRIPDVGDIALDAGTIAGQNGLAVDTACPGVSFTIRSTMDAYLAEMSDVPMSYIWYVDNVIVPNQTGAELNYVFDNTTNTLKTFVFKRKAVCAIGENMTTAAVTIMVPNAEFNLSYRNVRINSCGSGSGTTATAVMNGANATYSWFYSGELLTTGAIYTPFFAHFKEHYGEFEVVCEGNIMGCLSRKVLSVSVADIRGIPIMASENISIDNCGEAFYRDVRDNQTYCTIKIGNQCWVGRNLNVGEMVLLSDNATASRSEIQKQCKDNLSSYCDSYGGLYGWNEAVNGELTTKKYVAGTTMIQGICPEGWHLPNNEEWEMLLNFLGSDAGIKMKNAWGWDSGCNGTNQSSFSALQEGANWWQSTPNYAPGSGVCFRYIKCGSQLIKACGQHYDATYGSRYNVRCILN